ncbi:MAG: hypothetical protein KGM17_05320 [Sphingomonadales bacterium]|nr:hypothetical protein [Sphingomonadales bacterium]
MRLTTMTNPGPAAAAVLALLAIPAQAQQPAAAAAPASATALRTIILPAGMDIAITPDEALSSKWLKTGDSITFTTLNPVIAEGAVLIPRGTHGVGTVVYARKTGAFGRSGKLDVSFQALTLKGFRIPLEGRYSTKGEGNAGAVIGAWAAIGVLGGAVVHGHSARVEDGEALHARTVQSQAFVVRAPVVAAR